MDVTYYLSMFLLSAVSIIPYAIGCYIPYWDCLRLKPSVLVVLLAFVFTAETLFLGLFSEKLSFNVAFFSICFLDLLIYCRSIAAPRAQLLFCFLFFIQFAAIIRGISFFIESSWFQNRLPFSLTEAQSYFSIYFLELAIAIAVISAIGRILKHYFIPLMNTVNIRQWRILFTIPLIFTAIILTIVFFLTDQVDDPFYLILLLIISAGTAAIYFIVFLLLRGIADNAVLRERNLELGFYEQYYALLSERVETAKRARHDVRHHLRLLMTYLKHQDYDGAMDYLEEYQSLVSSEDDFLYCPNPAANMLLNYYAGLASDCGIKTEIDARLPQILFIHTTDLCALLGNLLENAIEGCQRQDEGERWLQLHLTADENKMAVAMDNSCGKVKRNKRGQFLSTKNSRTGIGLSSLSFLAQKYDGSAWFEEAGGIFKSSVVLHANTTKTP